MPTLDNINATLLQHTNVNIWKNFYSVINWFENIKNKSSKSFNIFDLFNFYPSISEDLLYKAVSFASHLANIPTERLEIILHSKKSILLSNSEK